MRWASLGAVLLCVVCTAHAESPPSGWPGDEYYYTRNVKLAVEETTPTQEQAAGAARPPQIAANLPMPVASTQPAQPLVMGAMNVVRLRFRDAVGQDVTALLCTPRDKTGPFPVVIALHGRGGNKANICGQLGEAMASVGFAILAPDLPNHGEQPGDPKKFLPSGTWKVIFSGMHRAVIDVRQCIDVAEKRPELDTKWGVILMGSSLGTVIDTFAGPADKRVKGMCLFVAGTYAVPTWVVQDRMSAAIDAQLSMPYFAPRALLMLNGTQDTVCTPEMARRLFDAAREPKQQIWYEAGHGLPAKANQDAAAWAAELYRKATARP